MQQPERVIGYDILAQMAQVLERHQFGHTIMMVCDDLTWIAAGARVLAHIGQKYRVTSYSLGQEVHAELRHAEELRSASERVDALIAVGSGTINDITKYAAAKLNKPYISVATAASMNGYTSANASLSIDGLKHSFAARPPVAVVADLHVIGDAPLRLARSGLGDTLCRSTVEADALLSHLLLDTPYPRAIFDKLRKHETLLIQHADKLAHRNRQYIAALVETLLDAGDAMTEFGSSGVASQGEHMVAHTAEMMYPKDLARARHGELIAVTTLSMAEAQHQLLTITPQVKPLPQKPSTYLRIFGQYLADGLMETYSKKLLTEDKAAKINKQIDKHWPDMVRQLSEHMVPQNVLERALLLAGVPTRPYDIKLDVERYKHALHNAFLTRDRFTFLDLAAMN